MGFQEGYVGASLVQGYGGDTRESHLRLRGTVRRGGASGDIHDWTAGLAPLRPGSPGKPRWSPAAPHEARRKAGLPASLNYRDRQGTHDEAMGTAWSRRLPPYAQGTSKEPAGGQMSDSTLAHPSPCPNCGPPGCSGTSGVPHPALAI